MMAFLKSASRFGVMAGLVLCVLTACAEGTSTEIVIEVPPETPHSKRAFAGDPSAFSFVVVGDRTGGHRPGVFAAAMHQLSLLQPSFVLSVGDLIEGYTESESTIIEQWDALDAIVETLPVPFFYTAGNHDLSNPLMTRLWESRLGKTYWHFVYDNVLFISLNTEDPTMDLPKASLAGHARLEAGMAKDPVATQKKILAFVNDRDAPKKPGDVAISDTQVAYVASVLNRYPSVRWTFLLMHKPAWLYDNQAFAQIESLLGERQYSVIAGHEHYYSHEVRHGRDYIDMGTTGGVWLKDGPGRTDHVLLVTMADSGPVYANIKLNGLADERGVPDPIFDLYDSVGR